MSEEYGIKFVVTGEYYDKLKKSLNEQIEVLQQKVEQLENENFNIRENIHLERISLPPELTKDKNFMELYDIPSYKDLQQKVEQLVEECQRLDDEETRLNNILDELEKWLLNEYSKYNGAIRISNVLDKLKALKEE